MDFHALVGFALTLLLLGLTHAASPPEVYWQSLLPGTTIPKALRDLLPTDKKSDNSYSSRQENPRGTSFKDSAFSMDINIGGLGIGIGNGGVSVGFGDSGDNPFSFSYDRSENPLASNQNAAFFFQGKDLRPGKKMKLHFAKTGAKAKLLPRQVADIIPFSSDKFSEILHKFSVNPDSTEAKIMKKTVEACEDRALENEDKYCATSLEAMVDYSISKLGKNVGVMATEIDKGDKQQQEFKITRVRMVGNGTIVCHALNYIYPVFYCHQMYATRAYIVPLLGADLSKAKAIAVCHIDTSKWNPNHVAFRVLKVTPGTVPICHFLPEDHIIWIAN